MTVAPHAPLTRLALHLLCFVFPAATLVYLAVAPTGLWVLPWLLVLVVPISLDFVAGPERRAPSPDLPRWPFDLSLYVLAGLHLLNVTGLALMVSERGLLAFSSWMGILLVGASSGYSAIVVAHELVHRPRALHRQLGRLLLTTALYEHFYTEHIRGHHARVGTHDDPATARFREPLRFFLRRTVPGQFRSAWALEARRLRERGAFHPSNRVLQGVIGAALVLVAVLVFAGPAALVAHLLQAAVAVLLLECVNYIEHWGLTRTGTTVRPVDSWDCPSWFTYYTLVGLSRHSDHHAHAARPYTELLWYENTPKLPWGYWATVVTALFRNRIVLRRMDKELRRCKLGPYADEAVAAQA
ncbi:MAG: alkane 1-monooxygenase [Myxococcales bacterium]|nr:alkane 1-monooxygenase [Myxococcales bacterium]